MPEVQMSVVNGYRLPQPALCASNVFDLMKACWSEDSADRPSFSIILQYLAQLKLEHRPTTLVQRSYRKLSVQASSTNTSSTSSLVADEHGYVMAGSVTGLSLRSPQEAGFEEAVDFGSLNSSSGNRETAASDNYQALTRPSIGHHPVTQQDPVAIAMALRQVSKPLRGMAVVDEDPYQLPQDARPQRLATPDAEAATGFQVDDYEAPQDMPPHPTTLQPAGPVVLARAPPQAVQSAPAKDAQPFKPSAASSAAMDVGDTDYVNKATILAARNDPTLLASEDDTISFDDFVKRSRARTLSVSRMQPPSEAPPARPSRGRKRLKSLTRLPRFTRQSTEEALELDELTRNAVPDYQMILSETQIKRQDSAQEQTVA
jgi:hypothetical protein